MCRCRTGKDAEIVVDAQSCYNLWYRNLDWLVGFEIQELVRRLRAFVEGFRKFGIRLIFFFGGLTPEKKRNTWIQRRRKNLEEMHIIFDILKGGSDPPEHFYSIPPNMGITILCILKYILSCQVSHIIFQFVLCTFSACNVQTSFMYVTRDQDTLKNNFIIFFPFFLLTSVLVTHSC